MTFLPYPEIPYKIVHTGDIALLLSLGFLYEIVMRVYRHTNERRTTNERKINIHLTTLRYEAAKKRALGPSAFVETAKLERAVLATEKEFTVAKTARETRKARVAKIIKKCNLATNILILLTYWGVAMVAIDGSRIDDNNNELYDEVMTDVERASAFWKGFLFPLSYNAMAKALKYAALAVLAASSAEGFTGSAFTGLTPKLRNSAVATRATKSHGPDMSLVLVTGASRGIGKAIALELGKRGANVVVNYAGSKDAAEAVAKEIEGMGVKAMAIKADTSDPDQVTAMFKEIEKGFDEPISCLINNAGITRDTLVLRMKFEDWKAVIDVNLAGVFLCSQQAAKIMLKKKTGRIINISSVVGQIGNPGQANYAAAKGGVLGMTKAMAKEFATRGVTVNSVCPGFIESDMTAELNAEYMDEVKKMIPLGRLGYASEVAGMCAFLALDPACNYVTGHSFNVDGGIAIGQ